MTTVPVDRTNNTTRNYNPAALYVGDLADSVTEKTLFDLFTQVGPVASVRICRDSETKNSLNYGYVNYHSHTDAVRALNNINFYKLDNRDIRIMWSEQDASVRKSGVGNIFVKNLDESIDNKTLYDTFSVFGNIRSSKVAYDCDGKSLGYGFVHFEKSESAETAIRMVNNMEIATRVVEVCHFKPCAIRNGGEPNFTNVYVKNFTSELFPNESAFRKFFEEYGEVTSLYLPVDDQGVPSGFGFVNFKDPEVAKHVAAELNGREPENLYVVKALSKSARRNRLREQFFKWREHIDSQTAGRNVYVKNLAENVDNAVLRAEFEKYGHVESANVKHDDNGHPKGFGFVLFVSQEDAANAIKALHGKTWLGRVLFVALWQRKHIRQQHLEMQAQNDRKFMQQGFGNMYATSPHMLYQQQLSGPPGMLFPTMPITPLAKMGQMMPMGQIMPMGQMGAGGWSVTPARAMMPHMASPARSLSQQQQQMMQSRQSFAQHDAAQQVFMRSGASSTQQMQVSANENYHINVTEVGEMIYNRVKLLDSEFASKITGMFLEMDKERLMQVISDEETFMRHVKKAHLMILDSNEGQEETEQS